MVEAQALHSKAQHVRLQGNSQGSSQHNSQHNSRRNSRRNSQRSTETCFHTLQLPSPQTHLMSRWMYLGSWLLSNLGPTSQGTALSRMSMSLHSST